MPDQSTHPSPEKLGAYSLGQLPPDEASDIESHISHCEPCCETIVSLSADDTFVGLLIESKQIATEQTIAHDSATTVHSSSTAEVPNELTSHPRYEIETLIGKGGMGDVYKARHRMMDRTVALKVINRELVRKKAAVDRFHREVKTAAKLSHANVVTAHDAEQAGDVHFMVMEYVDGVDLARLVQDEGPLAIDKACDFVRQAALGLDHAHECGMVHRDIKPHNLMVTADGTIKILDFGLASLAPVTTDDTDHVQARGDLTAAGAIMGTPDFISPEQADDARQADIRSDIYSLGATLYFLLSGRAPFADGSVMNKLKSHAESEAAPLSSVRDDVPAELAAIVSKMMAKDPEKRFQTPAEIAKALKSLSVAPQPASTKPLQKQVEPRGERRRLWPMTAVATLVVAVIVAAVAYVFSVTSSDGPAIIAGGAGCDGNGWYLTSGSTYLKQNEPGVVFGMYEDPKGDRSFSYIVLVRHSGRDFTEISNAQEAGLVFDGEAASIRDGIKIDGKGIELDLELLVDESQVTSTKIAVDGQAVDASQGRLFLLDVTSDRATWNQVKADFPRNLPAPQDVVGDTKLVSKVAQQVTAQLAKDNDEVRKFVSGATLKTSQNPDARLAADRPSLRIKNDGTWTTQLGTESRSWDLQGNRLGEVVVRLLHISDGKLKIASEHEFRLADVPGKTAGRVTVVAEKRQQEQLSVSLNVTFDDASEDAVRTRSSPLIIPQGLLRSGATINVNWEGQRLFPQETTFVHTMVLLPKGGNWGTISHRMDDTKSMVEASKKGAEFVAVTLDWDYARPKRADSAASEANSVEALQGEWQVVTETEGGVLQDASKVPTLVALTVEGNSLTLAFQTPGREGVKKRTGRIEVDNTKSPKTIDFYAGQRSGSGWIGIYEIEGDVLRICTDERRPKTFASPRDGDAILLECRRKQVPDASDRRPAADDEDDTNDFIDPQTPANSDASSDGKSNAFLVDAAKGGDIASVKAALDAGVDPNGPKNQLTALHWAVAKRLSDGKTIDPSPEIAKLLIEAGADVNAKDYLDQTPLEWAAKYASPEIVEMLIKAGADVNAESKYGTVLLAATVKLQDRGVEIAKVLIEAGADVNAGKTMTPLANAVQFGNVEMIRLLLDNEAEVNDPKNPPLFFAGKPDVAKALLEAGADVNQRNSQGETTLHLPHGPWFGPDAETLKVLLEAGADAKARSSAGSTPLHAAARDGKPQIARLLIEANADIDARDKQGNTPLSVAHSRLSWARGVQSVDEAPYAAALQTLVDAGAMDDGRTDLQHAVATGDLDQVEKLIVAKVNINETGPDQITAVHIASEGGHAKILDALIKAGAKPDQPDAHGMRPLHLAVNAVIARKLIGNGAKVNSGMPSPLYMATMAGKADVVQELLRNEAAVTDGVCGEMLNWATFAGRIEVIKVLLKERDAKTLLSVGNTYSPLHVAASGSFGGVNSPADVTPARRLDIARLLIEQGADVNEGWGANVDPKSGANQMVGATPLMFASSNGEPKLVELLLEHGADAKVANASGQTALHFAAEQGHRSVVELLLDAKVAVNAVNHNGKTPLELTRDASVKVLLIQSGGRSSNELLRQSQEN